MSERSVLKQITALQSASLAELRARWRELHDREPPARISRDLLVRRLAYRIQEQAFGGLSNRARHQLAALAPGNANAGTASAPRGGAATFDAARTGAGHGANGAAGDGRASKDPRASRAVSTIVPGTVLVREWRGRRDKVAAAKRKGKYTGGMPVLGYDVDRATKRLVVNAEEAKLVRHVFARFTELGSTTQLAAELNAEGHTTKTWTTKKGTVAGGSPWNKARLYRLLHNRKYRGQVTHKGNVFEGEHDAIISKKLWDAAHRIITGNTAGRASRTRAQTPALLKGILRCGNCGRSMGLTFTRKAGKTYRYYLCNRAAKNGYKTCPIRTIAAGEIEAAVIDQLRLILRTPEIVTRTARELRSEAGEAGDVTASNANASTANTGEPERDARLGEPEHGVGLGEPEEVAETLRQLDPVWQELFPAEQARLVRLLIERVDVYTDGLELFLDPKGLESLVTELTTGM